MKRINIKDMLKGWYKVWRNDSDPTSARVFVNLKPLAANYAGKRRFLVRTVYPGMKEDTKEFVNLKTALTYSNQERIRLGIARSWGVWIYDPDTTLVQKLKLQ